MRRAAASGAPAPGTPGAQGPRFRPRRTGVASGFLQPFAEPDEAPGKAEEEQAKARRRKRSLKIAATRVKEVSRKRAPGVWQGVSVAARPGATAERPPVTRWPPRFRTARRLAGSHRPTRAHAPAKARMNHGLRLSRA